MSVTVTIPSAIITAYPGRPFLLALSGDSAGDMIVATEGAETINGEVSITLSNPYDGVIAIPDGTNVEAFIFRVVLPVNEGGTGAITLTDHGLLLGSGTDPITSLAAATNGQLVIGSSAADPVLAALTGTANQIVVTNGAGSITLSLPQNIDTAADVDFGSLALTTNLSVGTDSPAAGFAGTGDIYTTSGIKAMEGLYAEAVAYGAGLEISDNALSVTYTGTGATLTAATQLITDAGATFTDAYIGQFLKVATSTPSYTGATGEIIAVPSTTTLIVSFATAGGVEITVDATAMVFVVYPHPRGFIGNNGDIHFKVGVNKDASFKVISAAGANIHSAHFAITAGVDGHHGLGIDFDPDTYGGCIAERINYDATAFVDGIEGVGLDFVIDNTATTGGAFHGIDIALADPTNTDMENAALATHTGVDVIHQHIGTQAAIAAAYITDASGDITATTIAFNDADPDTITDSGNGFVAAGFVAGQVIAVTGSTSNNSTYTIATVAIGTITLVANDTLTAEIVGDTVTITSTFRDVTTAFGAAGTDVELFGADNDVVLVASAAEFDQINVLLDTPSSKTISPTFHYSEAASATWTLFTVGDDTNGFKQNGSIRFDNDALTTPDWGVRTINEVIGAFGTVDYYWIKITRTRNRVPTPPTEDTIKVTTSGTFHSWDSEGRLGIKTYSQAAEPTVGDLPAGKFCFWSDSTGTDLWLCYNHNGTVKSTQLT